MILVLAWAQKVLSWASTLLFPDFSHWIKEIAIFILLHPKGHLVKERLTHNICLHIELPSSEWIIDLGTYTPGCVASTLCVVFAFFFVFFSVFFFQIDLGTWDIISPTCNVFRGLLNLHFMSSISSWGVLLCRITWFFNIILKNTYVIAWFWK